ncbi:MAG: ABC transporter ATP-binding protein [Pseudomonadota bacterium]
MNVMQSTPPHHKNVAGGGIALDRITKRFGKTAAVDDVSLSVEAGEFFVVLGPSGCGKSTLLRLIAGLERPDAGAIALAGRPVVGPAVDLPPEERNVAVVFQSYALWPHMSVRKNVSFPAEASGTPRDELIQVVDAALKAVSLTEYAARRPAALSGGQQQRVALARCLASRSTTVLMDEPLANLDVHLRAAMEDELMRVHTRSGATTLYITHDQREAMSLATRIAVMQAGRILQVASPEDIYERPQNADVARFIGRGSLIACQAMGRSARIGSVVIEAEAAAPADGAATLFVRPERVVLDGDGPFEGRVEGTAYRGGAFEFRLMVDGLPPIAATAPTRPGETARFGITGGWILPAA